MLLENGRGNCALTAMMLKNAWGNYALTAVIAIIVLILLKK